MIHESVGMATETVHSVACLIPDVLGSVVKGSPEKVLPHSSRSRSPVLVDHRRAPISDGLRVGHPFPCGLP